MIFIPKITYSITPDSVNREDHCLVVLPSTNGRTDFVSIRTYSQFMEYFGSEFHKPKEVDHSTEVTYYLKSEEEYSEGLLSTIKYLLNSGVPLLVTTASTSARASIRFYAVDKDDYSICSISHNKPSLFSKDSVINNLSSFIDLNNLKNYSSGRTLVHRIPLHITELSDGTKVSVIPDPATLGADYRGWFITLPVQKTKIVNGTTTYNNAVLSYLVYLNNSDKKNYSDLYASTTPIFDGSEVAILNYAGTYDQVAESVSRLNTLLQNRYQSEALIDPSVNNYRVLLDWENSSIIFLSNQYIPYSAVNSLPYSDDFYPDHNDSGWIMDKFTQSYAYLDLISSYTGDLSNLFNVNFIKSENKLLLRTSYGATIYDYTELYEVTSKLITTTDYLTIIQYPPKNLSDDSSRSLTTDIVDSLINTKIIELFGGTSSESVTYDDIKSKILEYSELDDTYPINYIFDCMSESLGFILEVGKELKSGNFDNPNIVLLANCYTPIDKVYVESILKPLGLNILYYHPYLAYSTKDEKVSLAAYIILNLLNDNYIPTITLIGYSEYLKSITPSDDNSIFGNDKWEYLNYPRINGTYMYLNEMKLARCSYEDSIDVYLGSKIHNDLTILFEPLIGNLSDSDDLNELVKSYLNYCDVCPTLIDRFELVDVQKSKRNLNITVAAYRQELAGGERILNININL